ncbi:hypothetical protein LC613_12230 [Nostoc sphaeroides CHAB 2801]|uniref:hypothetical protein n=1 Tax=Nostoc sphaeroides TaxID=446679 RepID=UPI000E498DF0|nr:hypothetical protein [Nostoc sphaeroides]MCC5628815.1 hypothetical protein [Nostoc sphaeroides CHAB 2801]
MEKLSSVVLAVFLFISTLFFGTPNANAQTTFPLIYGGTYLVQNGYNNWEGGYLDTNGIDCEGNLLCVSTAGSSDRANVQTRTWKIVSATGKQNGTAVLVNDEIYSQNLYPYRIKPIKTDSIAFSKAIAQAQATLDNFAAANSSTTSDSCKKDVAKAQSFLEDALTSISGKQAILDSLLNAEKTIDKLSLSILCVPEIGDPRPLRTRTLAQLLAAKKSVGNATAIAKSIAE